jgi:hypothetical protein
MADSTSSHWKTAPRAPTRGWLRLGERPTARLSQLGGRCGHMLAEGGRPRG